MKAKTATRLVGTGKDNIHLLWRGFIESDFRP
jgi:hypothetical protein